MKNWFLSLLLVLFGGAAWAQKEDIGSREPKLNEGKMFTVKFTPMAKRLEVALVGTSAVVLGPDRIEVFGRVIQAGQAKTLTLRPAGKAFEIVEEFNSKSPVEIEVKDKESQKKETFQFRLNERP